MRTTTFACATALLFGGLGATGVAHACEEATSARLGGNPGEAELLAIKCVNAKPRDLNARVELLRALSDQGRWEEALTSLEAWPRALTRGPSQGMWRVRLLAWSDDAEGALKAFDELPARYQRLPEARRLVANLLFWAGDYIGAIDKYSDVLARWPEDRMALKNRGAALSALGEDIRAVIDYDALCVLGDSDGCDALTELLIHGNLCPAARRARLGGDIAAALAASTRCLEERPSDPSVQVEVAHAEAMAGHHGEAAARLKVAVEESGGDWRIRILLARFLGMQGDHEGARAAFDALPDEVRSSREGLVLSAHLAFWSANHEAAIAGYDEVLRLDPNNEDALGNRAAALSALGEDRRALADRATLCELHGGAGPECEGHTELLVWGNLCPESRLEREAGHGQQAEALARRCVRDNPDEPAAWVALGEALAEQGRFDRAAAWFSRAATYYPNDWRLKLHQARFLAWQGAHEHAWELVENLPPEAFKDTEVLRLVADVAYWRQDWAEAIRRYDAYLMTRPDDVRALVARGRSYRALGDTTAAMLDMEIACTLSDGKGSACTEADQLEEGPRQYRVSALAGWTYIDILPDWYDVMVSFDTQLLDPLSLGGWIEYRYRNLGTNPRHDVILGVRGRYVFDAQWSLGAGVAFSPTYAVAPYLQLYIEPAWRVVETVTLDVRYWMLRWSGAGAHVFRPSVTWTPEMWFVRGEYYLGFTEDGAAPTHVGLARVGRYLPLNLYAELGIGGGNRADYLDTSFSDREWHWLLSAKIAWSPNDQHTLGLKYIFRDEREVKRRFQRHQFILSWDVDF